MARSAPAAAATTCMAVPTGLRLSMSGACSIESWTARSARTHRRDEFHVSRRSQPIQMMGAAVNRVVHLELHTADLAPACAFYAELLGWRAQPIDTRHGSYLALALGHTLGGGFVECPVER